MFSKTFAAFATAAVIAIGTVATAAPAQAGYHHGGHGGFVVKFGHGGYGHGGYGYGHGYGHYAPVYVPTCYYKNIQVWTEYGPEWVTKKFCS